MVWGDVDIDDRRGFLAIVVAKNISIKAECYHGWPVGGSEAHADCLTNGSGLNGRTMMAIAVGVMVAFPVRQVERDDNTRCFDTEGLDGSRGFARIGSRGRHGRAVRGVPRLETRVTIGSDTYYGCIGVHSRT